MDLERSRTSPPTYNIKTYFDLNIISPMNLLVDSLSGNLEIHLIAPIEPFSNNTTTYLVRDLFKYSKMVVYSIRGLSKIKLQYMVD